MEVLVENLTFLTWQQVLMWLIGGVLIYLAIVKEMEPSLLLPMGFGAILVNLPNSGAAEVIAHLFELGIAGHELFPLLLFIGIGAMIEHSEIIRKGVLLAGSLVVMYMGLRLMLSREVAGPAINVNIPLMKTIGMACVVTWFNPQAIIDVSLLLGSFRVALPPEESGLFLWGVVCASCLWFLSLTTISSLFKNRFTPRLLRIINLVCGLVIFFYGVKLGWSFVELWQSAF